MVRRPSPRPVALAMRPPAEWFHFNHLGRAPARRTHHQIVDALVMRRALRAYIDVVAVVSVAGAAAERLVQIDEASTLEARDGLRAGNVVEVAREYYRALGAAARRRPSGKLARLHRAHRHPIDQFLYRFGRFGGKFRA